MTGLTPISLLYYQIGFGDSFTTGEIRWTKPDKINSGVPAGEKLVLRLKAIGLIYTDVNDQVGITQATEEDIQKIEELYRNTALFIWQNTGFNVWIDFVAMPRYTGDFIRDNKTSPEAILSDMGYSRADDIDLVLDTSICWGGAGGGYGGSGGMFGRGIGWSYQEWDDGRTIIHEVNHIFDFAVYGWHDIDKYEAIHPIWSIKDAMGGDRSCNGQVYRNLSNANYTATGGDFSKWIVVPDSNNNGIPDYSPTDQGLVTPFPITKQTLGLSPTNVNTQDELSDYEKATYYYFGGLDPQTSYSRDELNPGYPIGDHITKATPTLGNGLDAANWTIVTDHWGYENLFGIWDNNAHAQDTRTAMAWDDQYLYFGIEYAGWDWVSLRIDGGCDNWHYGPATYEIGLHPWLEVPEVGFVVSHQDMQMMIAAEYGDFFWDSDPRFTNPYQGRPVTDNPGDGLGFEHRLIDSNDIMYVKQYDDETGLYTWEIAIPWSPNVTGLAGYDQKMIGISATVLGDQLFSLDSYAKIQLVDPDVGKPSVPTNFRSVALTTDSVSLAWDAVTDVTGYLLQYKKSSDTEWTTASVPTGTSATITGLTAGTDYNFRVQAASDGGESDWATVNATTDAIVVQHPTTPTNFRATAQTTNSVTLVWDAVTDATGYVLQYKKANETEWTTASVPTGTSATITGLTAGTNYNFRVQAASDGGESDWATVNATTHSIVVQPPATPSNFRVTAQTSNSVTLAWNVVNNAAGYVLQYKKANETGWTTAPDPIGISAAITGLMAGTDYNFRVQATNVGGVSGWATVNATTDKIKLSPPTLGEVKATGSSTIGVAWNAVENANGYTIQYATNAGFTAGVGTVAVSLQTTTSADITGLGKNTTYYVRIMATGTGVYTDSDYSASKSATTPELDAVTMPDDDTPHDWVTRKIPGDNSILQIVDLKDNRVLYSYSLDTLEQLTINSSATANDSLTIDFSNGAFLLDNGIHFNGNANTYDTLYFIGTNGDDSIVLDGMENRFNDLPVYTQNIEHYVLEAGDGNDQALVVGTNSNNTINVSDELLVMVGGGYRWELGSFNVIDAIADGRHDRTYLYAENDSIIVMNETFVEHRLQNQTCRVWYSEQVTAINIADTNSTVLLADTHGFNAVSFTQGYGTITNAAGSFFHEFFSFDNIIAPFITSQHAASTTHVAANAAKMEPVAAKMEPAFADEHWDDHLFAFLADDQMRLHRKKDAYHDADNWLDEFEKLALLELMK